MNKKWYSGIILLAVLLILGSIDQLRDGVRIESYRLLAHPLPELYVIIRYAVAKIFIFLGLITAIGLFFRRNISRVFAIIIGIYLSVFYYLIEGPLAVKNLISYGVDINGAVILKMIGEFSFGLSLILFFTRPKVKEMFR
ncbi:MAG: hypothetical protein NG740_00960 [Omnitrophica bacterium]|nr:hypothetical protein [Candidatus Omnitrophota bacterium]